MQSYLSEQDLFGEEQIDTTLQVLSLRYSFSMQHDVGVVINPVLYRSIRCNGIQGT